MRNDQFEATRFSAVSSDAGIGFDTRTSSTQRARTLVAALRNQFRFKQRGIDIAFKLLAGLVFQCCLPKVQ